MTIHGTNQAPPIKGQMPLKEWGDLPDMVDVTDIMPMCAQLMGDHPDRDETIIALASFVNQFLSWQNILLGGSATAEEMENIMTGESIVLDMTNDWFRRTKPILDPVIMQCKSCLTLTRILKAIGKTDDNRLEEEMDLVWYQFVRMWDFVPWFTFMCTGSMVVYTSVRLLMSRYCVCAKPEFTKRYLEMRNV